MITNNNLQLIVGAIMNKTTTVASMTIGALRLHNRRLAPLYWLILVIFSFFLLINHRPVSVRPTHTWTRDVTDPGRRGPGTSWEVTV